MKLTIFFEMFYGNLQSPVWKRHVEVQYRSKVSYHPLARRDSSLETRLLKRDFRLERRESRLMRALKNFKYGWLNFSWDFSSLMLTVQQQRSKTSKTLRYLTKLWLRAPAPRTVCLPRSYEKRCNSWKSQIFVTWEWYLWICCKFLSFKSKTYRLSLPQCV